jgi:hypothetical protein
MKKVKNYKEGEELIKRYHSITLEEIIELKKNNKN